MSNAPFGHRTHTVRAELVEACVHREPFDKLRANGTYPFGLRYRSPSRMSFDTSGRTDIAPC
jgi:hypothetical protein